MDKIASYALLGMFAFVVFSNTAISTSWDPVAREIPYQVNHSDRIVIGTVKELHPGLESTDVVIRVDEWLKNPQPRNEITVRTEQGTNAFTAGAANFSLGEKALLMLRDIDAGKGKFSMPFIVVNMVLSVPDVITHMFRLLFAQFIGALIYYFLVKRKIKPAEETTE